MMYSLDYKVPREKISTNYNHIRYDGVTSKYLSPYLCTNLGQTKDNATHLSLAGGAYNLYGRSETNDQELFQVNQKWLFERLKHDYEKKAPFYLVEMRGKVFPLLFDFDMHGKYDMSLREFLPLIQCVQRLLKQIYPHLSSFQRRAIICTADPIIKKRDVTKGLERFEMQLVKRGFHLIYPDLITDQVDALFLREALIDKLKEEFKDERYTSFVDEEDGEKIYCEKYDTLVDPTVITSNGLRMIGAHKTDKCPRKCKKSAKYEQHGCAECGHRGRSDLGRPYYVLAEMDGDGQIYTLDEKIEGNEYSEELFKMHNDFVEALQLCSIIRENHVQKVEPQWENAKITFNMDQRVRVNQQEEQKLGMTKLPRKVVERYVNYPGEYSLDRSKWKNVHKGHKGWNELIELIKSYYGKTPWMFKTCGEMRGDSLWHAMGEDLETVSVSYTKGQNPGLRAYPITNFCPNVGRVHTSNRTYFDIYFHKESNEYRIKPGCYSTNSNLEASKSQVREVCKYAHRLFRSFEVPLPLASTLNLLLQLADAEKDLYQPKSTDLAVQISPEYSMDPALVPKKLPTAHKYCYYCFKFVMPKNSATPACKCAEPTFAPFTFECQTCYKTFTRKREKKRKNMCPWLKTEYMEVDVCKCEKPAAPEEFRDTMGPDLISNSILK